MIRWICFILGTVRGPLIDPGDEFLEYDGMPDDPWVCAIHMRTARLIREGGQLVAIRMTDTSALAVVPRGMNEFHYQDGTTLEYEPWIRDPGKPSAKAPLAHKRLRVESAIRWSSGDAPFALYKLEIHFPETVDQLVQLGCLPESPNVFEVQRGISKVDDPEYKGDDGGANSDLNSTIAYWDGCHDPYMQLTYSVFGAKFTKYEGCFSLPEMACTDMIRGEPLDNGQAPWGLVTDFKILSSPHSDTKRCVGKVVALNHPKIRDQLLKWWPDESKSRFIFNSTREVEEVPISGLIHQEVLDEAFLRFDKFHKGSPNWEDFIMDALIRILVLLVVIGLTLFVTSMFVSRRSSLRQHTLEFNSKRN